MYKNKKIIYIYGPSGAGSTTLGEYFCKNNRARLIDTDTYFLRNSNPQDRYDDMVKNIENALENIIVITGSFWNWKVNYSELVNSIDLFVRNELDVEIRIKRLRNRQIERWGENTILPGGTHYNDYLKAIEFTKKYENGDLSIRSKATFEYYEKKFNINVLSINSINCVDDNMKIIENKINAFV